MNSTNTDTTPAYVYVASPAQVKGILEKEILFVVLFMNSWKQEWKH